MAFFDKLKNVANTAKETVMAAAESAKVSLDQKKAEQEAYNADMTTKAAQMAQTIVNSIEYSTNGAGIFASITQESLLAFTKEFYDKILMPANSVSKSSITMYPYIVEKKLAKFKSAVGIYDDSEIPILHMVVEKTKEVVITDKNLYFLLPLAEDPKFSVKGIVSCDRIGNISVDRGENGFVLMCNDYALITLPSLKAATEDGITLNRYFSSIANHSFAITDEEVDRLIQEKIGDKVYAEVKKYLVYDDELLVYFAWGLDSLSAKDYFVCTNKQVIMVNREMGGATANIKQFYYEDITSASVLQNSNNATLTGYLLETALTAALQTCDLVLTVAGAITRINNLYKVEAERVVAVYHQYRKAAKVQSAPQQVIVQQTSPQVDPMEQLEKLAKLKAAGIITEEEFSQKKADVLAKI